MKLWAMVATIGLFAIGASGANGSTSNFGFAVFAEVGLNLVITGYDDAGNELFSESVGRQENYEGKPHYVIRVDEQIIFSNTMSKWCVEDLSGKWTALPDGVVELCDEHPTDRRGTFVFATANAVAVVVQGGAQQATELANGANGSTSNFGFAVLAEAGLNLVISGYDDAGNSLFSEGVGRQENYEGKPHYVIRVDEQIIFSNTMSKWCVEDLSGKWTALPDGAVKLCDEHPTDRRGTFVFATANAVAVVVQGGAQQANEPADAPLATAKLPSQNQPAGVSQWRWGKNDQGLCVVQGVPMAKDHEMPRDAEPYLFVVNAVEGNPNHFGINLGTPPAGSQFYVMIDGYAYPVQPAGKVLIPLARSISASGALLTFSYSALRHAGKAIASAMGTGKELVLQVVVRDGPNAGTTYRDVYDLDGFALAKAAADKECSGVAKKQLADRTASDGVKTVAVSQVPANAVECLQLEFAALGLDVGAPNGTLDKKTVGASKEYAKRYGAYTVNLFGFEKLDKKWATMWCLEIGRKHPALASISESIGEQESIRFGLDADGGNLPTIAFMASGTPLWQLQPRDLADEQVDGKTLHLADVPYTKVREMDSVCFEAPSGFDMIDKDGERHDELFCSGRLSAGYLAAETRDWFTIKMVKEQIQ